jgi:hypothetical protein
MSEKYDQAIREVISAIQVIIYRREETPIRGRDEVNFDLGLRLAELKKYSPDGKINWRRRLLELAAYAVWAAVGDE